MVLGFGYGCGVSMRCGFAGLGQGLEWRLRLEPAQRVPKAQKLFSAPGPPSSHTPLLAFSGAPRHVLGQLVGCCGGDGGGCCCGGGDGGKVGDGGGGEGDGDGGGEGGEGGGPPGLLDSRT